MAGIALSALARSASEWLELCREAEQLGFAGAWGADSGQLDAFVDAALALSVTERLPAGIAGALLGPRFHARFAESDPEVTGSLAADRAARGLHAAGLGLPEEVARATIPVTTPGRFRDDLAAIACVETVFPLPCDLHWPNPGPEWGLGPAEVSAGHLALRGAMFGRELI